MEKATCFAGGLLLFVFVFLVPGCTTPVEFYIINSTLMPYTIELYLPDSGDEYADIVNYISGSITVFQFVPETLKIAGFKNKTDVNL